jgi:hypothetical protein
MLELCDTDQWILSTRGAELANFVIISPFKANELLSLFRLHEAVTLHLYTPHVSASIPSLKDLASCPIPPAHEN